MARSRRSLHLLFEEIMEDYKKYCISVLEKVDPGSTFLSVREYKNNFGEISNFSVVFHVNYLNAIKKAKRVVENLKFIKNQDFSKNDFVKAQEELLASFDRSLTGYNPDYTCHGVYEPICGADGRPLQGVRLHLEQGVVHINALRIRKSVLIEGVYPKVNSAPKTIAKRFIKSQTPLKNWVQFKLVPKRFKEINVAKQQLK